MRIPLSWLKEYVDVTMPVEELAHRLTMAGVELGSIERVGGEWEHCSVGHVLAVEPHPNADRLTLCTVDAGGEQPFRVVCGAPNVVTGQKIAFARVGANLYNTHSGVRETLKAARIRGELSKGMICSELELGLGEDHTGILVLPPDASVGAPLNDYLGDTVLDLEVTANRVDCLSVLGVAYEVGASVGVPVREPECTYAEEGGAIGEQVTIRVEDAELCPRYTASLVLGVKVGPSPQWMQERLLRAGMRPINNVVDITNYVMLEQGQPLHAFDYHTLKGSSVIVRQAASGETLTSLDGVERKLAPPMLVIADERDPVGMAGVVGGANSEVTEGTTAVLLESASFHPLNTRRTASALGIRTEASIRFEKGLRPGLPPIALSRATRLMLELAGGVAAQGIIDIYPEGQSSQALTLTLTRLEKVLGMAVPSSEANRVLTSLGFSVDPSDPDTLLVTVPPWRADIGIEDDLVEEVARVLGYDQLPTTMLATPIPYHQPDSSRELREQTRDLLAAAGFEEVISYSLVSRESLEQAPAWPRSEVATSLRVANPMSQEHEWLRPSLRSGLLIALAANRRHEDASLRLFEIGRVYLNRLKELPDEREMAGGVMVGRRRPLSWHSDDNGSMDFSDAKGVMEELLERLGVQAAYYPLEDQLFIPGRAARIIAADTDVGVLGEVHPSVLEAFDVGAGTVALFELDLQALLSAVVPQSKRFHPLARFPGALRDLALLVNLGVPAARVQESIMKHPLVSEASLFDVYVGPQVSDGVRSLAYRVLFQSPQRTLTAAEVGQAMEELLVELQRGLGAVQRQG